MGPVGLLVAAMAMNNLQLAAGFAIQAPEEPDMETMEVPWQMLKPMLNEFTVRARQHTVMTNRSAMKDATEVDHFLF